ncbi:MAG TPA: hypothetical protein VFP50_20290 [Anaeromyxobacteraceae bacterium]|nr:hypothetical protein [Anaeromyxobacteraceae bacterium]
MLLCLTILLPAAPVLAVSGAAYTTFNAHVDGASKDVCKNSAINCNIYGAKEYVWLNGGPTANGLGPDGQYFFAVLMPGGQSNPNDGGAKNLSDDYDAYTNRTFTVASGEVSAYSGTHWLDDGKSGPKPNGRVPYIRLFPYADTTNPGGVYILAICSLERGYPVDPRDCKYDAFKVKKGKIESSFYLGGMKFEDRYADGVKDLGDPGLAGWTIVISGSGPDGLPFHAEVVTDELGYWEYWSPIYTLTGGQVPLDVVATVCEVLQAGWTQSSPGGDGCRDLTLSGEGFASALDVDFGNWRPVGVTACKARDLDGKPGGATVPVAGWPVSLTRGGVVVDTQLTGADGCYAWTGLTPGFTYDVHEGNKAGWMALGGVDFVFDRAVSGGAYAHTFVNAPLQGCTPGFWQGGNDFGTAGGKWLWNEDADPQWLASGGTPNNPYIWTTGFCAFFGGCAGTETMWYFVNPDGWVVNDDFHKAARSLVAAYLNASWGMAYPYATGQLETMWASAVASGDLLALHVLLDAANNAYGRTEGGPACPISASMP